MSFLCGDFNFAPSPSQVNFGSNFYGDWGCCGYRVPGGVATFVYLIIFLCECMISLPVCSMLTTKWKVPIFEAKVYIFGTWRCQSYLKLGQYALNRYGPNIWGVWPYDFLAEKSFHFLVRSNLDQPPSYSKIWTVWKSWQIGGSIPLYSFFPLYHRIESDPSLMDHQHQNWWIYPENDKFPKKSLYMCFSISSCWK